MTDVIYVLSLKDNKWYVGRSSNVERRFEQHKKGDGAKWTYLHLPINIHEIREMKTEYDEDNITLKYMKKYGIYNVRGGQFCALEFKPQNIRDIKQCLAAMEMKEAQEQFARNIVDITNKVKNELFNSDSELRSGRWFKKTFGF